MPEEYDEKAKEVVARGYRGMKFDPFGTDWKELAREQMDEAEALVAAVRAAVGDETELLIERLLYKIAAEQETTNGMVDIIDIGTGSGNIIITLARETKIILPKNHMRFFGREMSSEALTVV